MGCSECVSDNIRMDCVMKKVARTPKVTLSFADKMRQLLSARGDFRMLMVDVIA